MIDKIRKSINYKAVDFIGAIASSLFIAYHISTVRNSDGIYVYDSFKCLILAIGSFMIAAILVYVKGERRGFRIPAWISIALSGTIISYLGIIFIPNEIDYWNLRKEGTLLQYIEIRLHDIIPYFFGYFIIIGLIALFIMGLTRVIATTINRIKHT